MDSFSASEEKKYSNAEYKFISDEGLYSWNAIYNSGYDGGLERFACRGSFSHVLTVVALSSA